LIASTSGLSKLAPSARCVARSFSTCAEKLILCNLSSHSIWQKQCMSFPKSSALISDMRHFPNAQTTISCICP
jgi:hypothetical protein